VAPPANPDASRSAPGRRRRWRRARAGAGATAVSARHGPGGRCGCVGSAVPRRAAPRGGRHRNRRGRSSDDRDRSGCTARPAHDNARTGTGGRDGRPVARLPGRTPEERQWPAACDVQARSRRHKLHSHPATWRGCRARRPDLSCHAMGRHRARLPLGHAEVLPQPARPAGQRPTTCPRPAKQPPCRAAAWPAHHLEQRPPRIAADPSLPYSSPNPPFTGLGTKPPPHRRKRADPDRRSQPILTDSLRQRQAATTGHEHALGS